MIHLAERLGFTTDELLLLRVAMLGWQLAVRDHSFFEVMLAFDNFGEDLNYPPPELKELPWIRSYDMILPKKKLRLRSFLEAGTNSHAKTHFSASKFDLAHLESHLGVHREGKTW